MNNAWVEAAEVVTKVIQMCLGILAILVYTGLLLGSWPPPNLHGYGRSLVLTWAVLAHIPILGFALFVGFALPRWTIALLGLLLLSVGVFAHFAVVVMAFHTNSIAVALAAFALESVLFGSASTWLWRCSKK